MDKTMLIVTGTASLASAVFSGVGSWIACKAQYQHQQDIKFNVVLDSIRELKTDTNRQNDTLRSDVTNQINTLRTDIACQNDLLTHMNNNQRFDRFDTNRN